jgi:hypothetical protein
MKQLIKDFREYKSPEVTSLECFQDCILCASEATSFDNSQLGGFDQENEFTGWGN